MAEDSAARISSTANKMAMECKRRASALARMPNAVLPGGAGERTETVHRGSKGHCQDEALLNTDTRREVAEGQRGSRPRRGRDECAGDRRDGGNEENQEHTRGELGVSEDSDNARRDGTAMGGKDNCRAWRDAQRPRPAWHTSPLARERDKYESNAREDERGASRVGLERSAT